MEQETMKPGDVRIFKPHKSVVVAVGIWAKTQIGQRRHGVSYLRGKSVPPLGRRGAGGASRARANETCINTTGPVFDNWRTLRSSKDLGKAQN